MLTAEGNRELQQEFLREAKAMIELDNRHIVRLIGICFGKVLGKSPEGDDQVSHYPLGIFLDSPGVMYVCLCRTDAIIGHRARSPGSSEQLLKKPDGD